jgi:hypothetical protein
MSDLSSLMSIAPTTAAGFMGINQAQGEQMNSMKMRELADLIAQRQAAAQQDQQMNPLKMEHQRLQNQGLEAGLGSISAKSQTDQLNLGALQQTQPSGIEATISGNRQKVQEDKSKDNQRLQDFWMKIGPQLKAVQGPLRGKFVMSEMQRQGLDPNAQISQMFMQALQNSPDQFLAVLEQMSNDMGKNAAAASPAYHQATDTARIQEQRALEVARINAGGTIRAAEIGAESRKHAADAKANKDFIRDAENNLMNGKTKVNERPGVHAMLANHYESMGDTKRADFHKAEAERAEALIQNRANARPVTEIPGIERTTPAPAYGSKPAVPKVEGIPEGAVKKLQDNPNLAAAFDAKYGAGASRKVLGK